jgi:magnesium chelatase family protein
VYDIVGQYHVKRALEVAAAGRHNILLVSPPDVGEAELARTLPSLLPILSVSHPILEPACSIEKKDLEQALLAHVTVAQGGVLFFKDLDTFDPSVLSSLSRTVRTQVRLVPGSEAEGVFPAALLVVATVKPCPCGYCFDPGGRCSLEAIASFRQRLKDVVHTCFDVEINVAPEAQARRPDVAKLFPEDRSADIRARVEAAYRMQQRRYTGLAHLRRNADLRDSDEVGRFCQMSSLARDLLSTVQQQLCLTPLQVLRLPVVARTIADLDGLTLIGGLGGKHMAEAILYLSRFIRDE